MLDLNDDKVVYNQRFISPGHGQTFLWICFVKK